MRYLAARALHSLFLLIGVSILCFLFASLAPGDFYSELSMTPQVSSGTISALRKNAGEDRPFVARYGSWVASVARGDFGYSLAFGAPAGPIVRERIGATLLLTVTATLLAWLIAVPWGVWSAASRGKWVDGTSRVILASFLSFPNLLLAIVLLAIAAQTGAFPIGGLASRDAASLTASARLRDTVWHLALPVAVLVAGMLPVIARHVRSAVAEALDSPFVLNARAQGIPRRRLLFRHALPAALNPLITLFGLSLGTLLSASLLVEVVVGWPGLGPLFLDAIMARDFAIVLAVVMLSTVFLIAGNLVADLLLYRFDPRIRVRS
ncbi:MAG TPA: ABC transporter permease [Candidatus Limnocylindrales bacterium]|nr:ABC transporter permease [Candidatus Limnocylindrales bacterium]